MFWRTIAYQGLPYLVNNPLTTEIVVARINTTDILKKSPTECRVDPLCCSDMAAYFEGGHHSFIKVFNKFEKDRKNAQNDTYRKKNARTLSNTSLNVTFTCGQFSRPCPSHIWLVRHERACSIRGHNAKSSFAKTSHCD